MFKIGTSV